MAIGYSSKLMKTMILRKKVSMAKQRGVILMLVLGFVATIALITFSGTESQRFLLRKAGYLIDAEQARDAALLALDTVERQLLLDGRSSTTDHLNEPWAQPLPMVLPEAMVWIGIEDIGRYWNINGLFDAKSGLNQTQTTLFEVALENRGQDPQVLGEVLDWIDSNDEVSTIGAGRELRGYFSGGYSYGPRNASMQTIDELQLLPLWQLSDQSDVSQWLSASAACPDSPVNINTASREALDLFKPLLLSDRDVDSILVERQIKPFETIAGALERITFVGEASKVTPYLSVQSQCFLVSVAAQVNKTKVQLSAEFVREVNRKEEVRIAKAWQKWRN